MAFPAGIDSELPGRKGAHREYKTVTPTMHPLNQHPDIAVPSMGLRVIPQGDDIRFGNDEVVRNASQSAVVGRIREIRFAQNSHEENTG